MLAVGEERETDMLAGEPVTPPADTDGAGVCAGEGEGAMVWCGGMIASAEFDREVCMLNSLGVRVWRGGSGRGVGCVLRMWSDGGEIGIGWLFVASPPVLLDSF